MTLAMMNEALKQVYIPAVRTIFERDDLFFARLKQAGYYALPSSREVRIPLEIKPGVKPK